MSDTKRDCYNKCCTSQKQPFTGRHDSDLCSALEYNPQPLIGCADIADILANVPGEHDGNNWHWIVKTVGGKIFLIEGGCDYTGWDCQSSAKSEEYANATAAANAASDDYDRKGIAAQLLKQLDGSQPYGTWKS